MELNGCPPWLRVTSMVDGWNYLLCYYIWYHNFSLPSSGTQQIIATRTGFVLEQIAGAKWLRNENLDVGQWGQESECYIRCITA